MAVVPVVQVHVPRTELITASIPFYPLLSPRGDLHPLDLTTPITTHYI